MLSMGPRWAKAAVLAAVALIVLVLVIAVLVDAGLTIGGG